jgi:two-component system, NtrC family, response regulator HydG
LIDRLRSTKLFFPLSSCSSDAQRMGRILLVDDEPDTRITLASHLRQDRHEIREAGGLEEARQSLAAHDCDAVLADQRMMGEDGWEVATMVRGADPTISLIFLTTAAKLEMAKESAQHGAFDFLIKPCEATALRTGARRACERTRLLRENLLLKNSVIRLEGGWEIHGQSRAMRQVREQIARVAPTNVPVLITGETGTGKRRLARAIHHASARASRPLVTLNCTAFTEKLLESELFGHEKGAFAGADGRQQGLLQAADEGTLFLDEVGALSPAAQAKLLRLLVDGQSWPMGSTQPRTVDVRVLVATERDLQQRVREGLFLEELLRRLAVVPIHMPPLRERGEDLADLCEIFSQRIATELKLPFRSISPAAIEKMKAYGFRANLRELSNLIERAYMLSGGKEIEAEHLPLARPGVASHLAKDSTEPLPDNVRPLPDAFDLSALLAKTEKELIMRVLSATGGTQAEAARRLGLSRSALAYKLNKYGIRGAA